MRHIITQSIPIWEAKRHQGTVFQNTNYSVSCFGSDKKNYIFLCALCSFAEACATAKALVTRGQRKRSVLAVQKLSLPKASQSAQSACTKTQSTAPIDNFYAFIDSR
jgi:hypothetical protein